MNTRLILSGLLACLILPVAVGNANADHRRHWFFDQYNSYEEDAFVYYTPRRWARRRPVEVYGDPDFLDDEDVLTEQEYRRMLRAQKRLRAKQRRANRKTRWRERRIRYDLAPKTANKPRIIARVPRPLPRPDLDNPNVVTGSLTRADEADAALAARFDRPETNEADKTVSVRPGEPEGSVTVKQVEPPKKIATIAEPSPPAENVKTEVKKKNASKPLKGHISCARAEEIVADFGFTDIEAKNCDGKSYDFAAKRDGKPFSIKLSSANGELTEVKRN